MTTGVLRADALSLPLADESVDLIVTSPPYFALRSYRDEGAHYGGQIGSEPTPDDFLAALWAVTRECWRVLKPSGSMFVNLGDKYAGSNAQSGGASQLSGATYSPDGTRTKAAKKGGYVPRSAIRAKSLMGMPWAYALGCIHGEADSDGIGWILRAEVVWSKPNGLPESVTDRVRRSHEQWFHFTKQGRYYSAIDELREPSSIVFDAPQDGTDHHRRTSHDGGGHHRYDERTNNALGKLPGSVWTIPSEPLVVPESVGVDHFAAFPQEWPRRIILGWSPSAICTACGEGRRPVTDKTLNQNGVMSGRKKQEDAGRHKGDIDARSGWDIEGYPSGTTEASITGYACACTPYVDHAGTGTSPIPSGTTAAGDGQQPSWSQFADGERGGRVGPWREYDFANWTPPPSRPSVVLDPFGGTGTVAMVAQALGRVGISVDLSGDYCRLAQWRINESDHDLKSVARTEGTVAAESLRDRRGKRRAGYVEMFHEERAADA